MSTKPSVVFFGTGPVAARSLELLLKNFEVEAVVTKPKPQHHRGKFPVLEVVNSNNLVLHEVTDKKSLSALLANVSFKSTVGILIDFGIIVSQDVIDYFEKGIINSHFSLLPEWRGADPITFSILSGQEKTGVSLMLLVQAMDEGPLLSVGVQPLTGAETTPQLTERLILLSDALLAKEVPHYLSGESTGVDQSKMESLIDGYPKNPSYSRKLTKADGILDWNKPAAQLEREVRAYIEWPKSRTSLGRVEVVITKARAQEKANQPGANLPGKIVITDHEVGVATAEGILWIEALKPAGKNEMPVSDFLRGYRDKI